MQWIKQGRIFRPDHESDWMVSHASVPVADLMGDGSLRLYFGARDAAGESRIGYVDVDAENPARVLGISPEPVLPLGPIGTFDENGIMPCSLAEHEGRKFLYYVGWSRRASVPYHLAIGLAVSDDGGATYRKVSTGPIADRDLVDPYFVTSPGVLVTETGWRMWYVSCTRWVEVDGRWDPQYHIRYAESSDGVHWRREGIVSIDYGHPMEALARPCVFPVPAGYAMVYSYRNVAGFRTDRQRSYTIGYATSADGVAWTRRDAEVGIERSETGWDSQMLAYPYILQAGGRTCLFYAGNGFGAGGVGYATLAP